MTLVARQTGLFRRDIKRVAKRGKDLRKLHAVINKIAAGQPLEDKYRLHPLTGDWKPCWECHVEPDWLLVYCSHNDYIELVRTGTHSDLFG